MRKRRKSSICDKLIGSYITISLMMHIALLLFNNNVMNLQLMYKICNELNYPVLSSVSWLPALWPTDLVF